MKLGFFKNVLARIGIGGTRIDTILYDNAAQVGGKVTGEVRIQGGTVHQQIREIDLVLNTKVEKESGDTKVHVTMPVHRVQLPLSFEVSPGEKKAVPFEMDIPLHSPISFGKVRLWIQTEAEILSAIDAQDHDNIKISPHPVQQTVLEAVEQLGFRLRNSDNEQRPQTTLGFEQELEYDVSPMYRARFSELKLSFQLNRERLALKMVADRTFELQFAWAELVEQGTPYVAQQLLDALEA